MDMQPLSTLGTQHILLGHLMSHTSWKRTHTFTHLGHATSIVLSKQTFAATYTSSVRFSEAMPTQRRCRTLDPAGGLIVKSGCVCRGAAEGEGLGNAFLSHIQAVDGIFHVCRGFEDPEVTHVEDRVDPVEDLEIIHK